MALAAEAPLEKVSATNSAQKESKASAARSHGLVGVGSCSASACHGGPAEVGKPWHSAYTVWATEDRHSQAYAVLYEPLAKQIVANLDQPAGIDHHVAVEIVLVADADADAVVVRVLRPEPAALRERVQAAELDLRAAPHAPAALHSVARTHAHAEQAVQEQAAAAERAPGRLEQQMLKTSTMMGFVMARLQNSRTSKVASRTRNLYG